MSWTLKVKKTKAPIKAGQLVRKWGTRYKPATSGDQAPFAVVDKILPNNKIVIIVGYGLPRIQTDLDDKLPVFQTDSKVGFYVGRRTLERRIQLQDHNPRSSIAYRRAHAKVGRKKKK